MNKNSLICRYIENHPDSWEYDFDKMNIRFKKDDNNLCIFKYNINADFSNPICKEARGIIIDLDNLDVVCIPYHKFFNSHEEFADEIDWSSAKVLEKLDGSLVKLYYNPKENGWIWATNGVIDARDAECGDFVHQTFQELIEAADNFKDINTANLNQNYTYMFEIVDPNMHPIKYDNIHLYHIGTRDKNTFEEFNVDIGIEKPKEYPLHNFEETLEYVSNMNKDLERIEHEGFVVVDKNWNRIKLKDPKYLELHYLASMVVTNKSKILELMHQDDIDIAKIIRDYPVYGKVFEYYENQEKIVEKEAQELIDLARKIYEKSGSRKEVAQNILGSKYQDVGFRSLGNEKTAKEILNELDKSKYEKLIDDYKEQEPTIEDRGFMF